MTDANSPGSGAAIRRLLLLRHAKSSRDDPSLEDHARPLASRGIWAAGAVGRNFGDRSVSADLVLCSSALRARETLRIVEPGLKPPRETSIEDELYLASSTELLERLARVDGDHLSVLLIGHNPGLEDLANMLCQSGRKKARKRLAKGFPTGTLAEVDLPIRSWKQLGYATNGQLRRFTRPKDLV